NINNKSLIFNLDSFPVKAPKKGVISLGCFDGIHLGHQKIISVMKAQAQEKDLKTALYVFFPHPFQVLNPDKPFKRLFSIRELKHILESYQLDFFGKVSFSRNFSQLSPAEFIQSFIAPQFQPKVIVVGYDFSFGRNREGRISDLRNFGREENFQVVQAPVHLVGGRPVSTSRIKEALSLGRMEEVHQLLRRSFFIIAPVVKGQGRGRKLGYPTANLLLPEDKLLPKKGVYSARVWMEDRKGHPAVLNIGYKPTFGGSKKMTIEVHMIKGLFDDLYNRTLRVEIHSFIREERAFKSSIDLQRQIRRDVKVALNNLSG
ncbi:MAG: riboflavin biosynthesis protein RibF, partial [Bdellovibrionales bacterium]|nr:riboflavin biosynthesis protein RibF [Bdellovibrionales bacterium]